MLDNTYLTCEQGWGGGGRSESQCVDIPYSRGGGGRSKSQCVNIPYSGGGEGEEAQ